MSDQTASFRPERETMPSVENDSPICEYGDCDRAGWVVLHFGPKLTPPLRVACHSHQSESDLSEFRDDVSHVHA